MSQIHRSFTPIMHSTHIQELVKSHSMTSFLLQPLKMCSFTSSLLLPINILSLRQPILDLFFFLFKISVFFHLSINMRPHHSSIISWTKLLTDSTHDPPPHFILRLMAKDAKARMLENKMAMYALLMGSTSIRLSITLICSTLATSHSPGLLHWLYRMFTIWMT